MSKLHNVRGRITYISSHTKQENLYAVYETTDRHYRTELARFNQQEFRELLATYRSGSFVRTYSSV